MATAMMPSYFPSKTDDLWKLANATVCDARDVASVLPVARPSPIEELMSGFATLTAVWKLRGGFRRLVDRQGKLVASFQAARPESWTLADCAHMSRLLDELLQDEKMMLTSAFASPKRVLFWWQGSLETLQSQTSDLELICVRVDALSVPETKMPGDEDYGEFMSMLNASHEHDFSPDI